MNGVQSRLRGERKALLATRAEFDRQRVTLAALEIKSIVAPSSIVDRVAATRPLAATLVMLMTPIAGAHRLGRWLRYASFALMAVRLAGSWRDRHRSNT
jgi:hypothetical protein